jgi:hypothetical protein
MEELMRDTVLWLHISNGMSDETGGQRTGCARESARKARQLFDAVVAMSCLQTPDQYTRTSTKGDGSYQIQRCVILRCALHLSFFLAHRHLYQHHATLHASSLSMSVHQRAPISVGLHVRDRRESLVAELASLPPGLLLLGSI